MRQGIHPEYHNVKAVCSCGNEMSINTTKKTEVLNLDVCSQCHPFYTGKQKVLDTGGRIDRFKQRFGNRKVSK
ncbi:MULTISPECIES: 50S ribosomal protein L31 [Gynuella]|uniref:50S ribosomal protein L31 n=1 Tax=Gynuella TaxID=1445504 RepID=UPI0005CC230F|nr:50S ribosomal protein L31 [Gynuella sunshinyii]